MISNIIKDSIAINCYEILLNRQSYFSDSTRKKSHIVIAGISLTIAQISENKSAEKLADLLIIPHTYAHTILKYYRAGIKVEVVYDQSIRAIASLLKSMLPNYIQARK